MSDRETLENELNDLLTQLSNLQVQQQRIQERIPVIVSELADTAPPTNDEEPSTRINPETESTETNEVRTPVARQVIDQVQVVQPEETRELFYNENLRPSVNDEVRILNPKPWQARNGVIQGFTRDGKLKIYTTNRQVIQRLPKNVVCTRRNHERN